jgi:hypothetical protein
VATLGRHIPARSSEPWVDIVNAGRRYILAVSVAVALTVTVLAVVRVPGTISAPGRITAHREWLLTRGTDGRIAVMLTNNAAGSIEELAVMTFERGDRVELSLSPNVRRGADVLQGDTIGIFRSELARQHVAEMEGRVLEERTALGMYSTGEKEAKIAVATYRLEQAEERVAFERRQVERLRDLVGRGMAAQSEYDTAQSDLRVAESKRERASAEVDAARAGAGQQVLEWHRAQLQSAERQLQSASERLADSVLIAPFDGRVVGMREPDVLVALQSADSCVVTFLVPWSRRTEIAPGRPLVVTGGGLRNEATGQVVHVGSTSRALNGRQFAEVTALAADGADLAPGLMTQCEVEVGETTALRYMMLMLFP